MKNTLQMILALILLAGCSPVSATPVLDPSPTLPPIPASTPTPAARSCPPTHDDGVSPSYKPDAPIRDSVGTGHVITGVVRSSVDCTPIANARLEFWPEVGNGHPDEYRATFFSDAQGRYRYECPMPDHIHMRVSADGYRTIGVNSYHPDGKPEGTLEIVLTPEK